MECIILVGGLGERLRKTLPNIPKPLAPVAGKPFLSYLMEYWEKQSVTHFILAAGYKSSLIQDYVGNFWSHDSVDISIEEVPLGTGGGFLKATKLLKTQKPFLLINGDTLFSISLNQLLESQSHNDPDILISLSQKENNKDRYMGVSYDENNKVISLNERNFTNPWVNAGTYLIHPRILQKFETTDKKTSLENELLPQLCLNKNHRIYVEPAAGINFIDIGTPEDYNKAQSLFTEGIYQ